MCFQSQGLASRPVKIAHFLNSTFTRKAPLAGICWGRSRLHVKIAARNEAWLCMTGETVWRLLLLQQPARGSAALTPNPSLRSGGSVAFPRQVPSWMEQGCHVPVGNGHKLRPPSSGSDLPSLGPARGFLKCLPEVPTGKLISRCNG